MKTIDCIMFSIFSPSSAIVPSWERERVRGHGLYLKIKEKYRADYEAASWWGKWKIRAMIRREFEGERKRIARPFQMWHNEDHRL